MTEMQSEFRPPDDELVDFILSLSSSLKGMASSVDLTENEKTTLNLAERNLKLLLAMTMSGYALYIAESQHSDDLALLVSELRKSLQSVSPLDELAIDISALTRYSQWRDSGPEESVPLFDGF